MFGLSLILLFLVSFSGVWVSLVRASDGLVEIELSVKGAYLRTDGNTDSPGIVDLESNGFSAGDNILISFEGSINVYGESDYETINGLGGVFSSTNQLLSVSEAQRVPGAIDAGEDFDSGKTHMSQQDTDIPEDFWIEPPAGFSIAVPQNAKYLFVSFIDSYYADNEAPEPIRVTIEKQASGFPFEFVIVALVLVVIAVLLVFVMFRRRTPRAQSSP